MDYFISELICIFIAVMIRWIAAKGKKSIKQVYEDKENEYTTDHNTFGCISVAVICIFIFFLYFVLK